MGQSIPDSTEERIRRLEEILVGTVEGPGGVDDNAEYVALRRAMMRDATLKALLPEFVRTCRDLDHFWPYIKKVDPQWAPRRKHVRDAMTPLFDWVESGGAPGDTVVSDALLRFDVESVYAAWQKALGRRHTDPEGAITSARTLLETVCKHVLDEMKIPYADSADLPALYKATAEKLDLAPSQYSEDAFRRILGGATSVVEGLGSLRNKIGDAHGHGKRPVKPSARHAHLAVNMAGAAATFIVETYEDRLEAFLVSVMEKQPGPG